jgi:hypothetical protein
MVLSAAQHQADQQSNNPMSDGAGGAIIATGDETPLVDLFTVNAVEPAIQGSGRRQINLNTPWSEELGRRVDERFGAGASQALERLFKQMAFDDESKIITPLIAYKVPMERWPDIIDALTTEDGGYHFGRVDINSASQAVLAALPGIEPEQAAEIVQMRDNLSADERATIVWPALKNILPIETYEDLAGKITTRSWTYRLRLAAGMASSDDPDGMLDDVLVYEMVIDLAAPRPRVAYWRDITLMQTTAIVAAASPRRVQEQSESPEEPAARESAAGSMNEDVGDVGFHAGENLNPADMNLDRGIAASDSNASGDSAAGDVGGARASGPDSGAATDTISTDAEGRKRLGRYIGGGG